MRGSSRKYLNSELYAIQSSYREVRKDGLRRVAKRSYPERPNILVPEANPDGTCRFHKSVRVDHFHATNGMGDIHGLDPSTAQANHLAEVSLSDEIYCGAASSAIHPASWPITSTTMMRWCDSPVV